MTKEDKAFKVWLDETGILEDKLLSKDDARELFDAAYDLGWYDCFAECKGAKL
jgi:hypothetical protein